MKKLGDIFDVWYGVNMEMTNCEKQENGMPFVSRSSNNNGIVGYVRESEILPNPGYTISVACSGSVLSTFYHPYKYYSGRDVYILKPKIPLSESEMIFYCAAIEKNKYRYNYGRQANKTLKEILIPSIEEIPKEIKSLILNNCFNKNSLIKQKTSLDASKWKFFKLDDIFEIYTSKDDNSIESQYGTTPYISSTQYTNGISGYIDATPSHNCNTITVARNGSVGSSFFHFYKYCASPDDVRILKPKFEINQYIGIFLITLLEKERYRYAYGRKFGTKRMKETRLKLPATLSGDPDWHLMENYIKSLPYSGSL